MEMPIPNLPRYPGTLYISNVPGPPGPLYLGGKQMLSSVNELTKAAEAAS